MNRLHKQLLSKPWYFNWHSQKNTSLIHWVIFLGIAISATIASTSNSNATNLYLSSNDNTALTISNKLPKSSNLPESTQIIVKYAKSASNADRDNIVSKQKLIAKNRIPQIDVDIFTINENDTAQEIVDRIKIEHKGKIEFVEVDAIIAPSYVPNDPELVNQWHLSKMKTSGAWDKAKGAGVTIAVLDTGVDCNHPDLVANCVGGWNVESGNTDSADVHGHGTKTAGTAAAVGDNLAGVAGVAYNSKIMPVKITNDPAGSASISSIASGITYAADHGAKVVSNSFQSSGYSTVQSAANYLRNKGGLFVASSGNAGALLLDANPASVITVGATDSTDLRAGWSNYGQIIDITAPGVGVYTTSVGGGYTAPSGTSFSAPNIAGVLALIFSSNPALTPTQAENILYSSATDLSSAGWDQEFGYGRADADAAVTLALSTSGSGTDTTAPSTPTGISASVVSSAQINVSWNPSTDNKGVTGYDVYRNTSKVASVPTNSYTDTNTQAETSYTYSVVAYDAAGNRSQTSGSVSTTTPSAAFSVQTYSITSKTNSTATITWTTNKPATVFIKYGTSTLSLNLQTLPVTTGALTQSIVLTGLKSRTVYYYQIIANTPSANAVSPVSSFRTLNK